MAAQTPPTLTQLLDAGTFVDVTYLAKRAGQPYPTFISGPLWKCEEINCSEERLLFLLRSDEFAFLARSCTSGHPHGGKIVLPNGESNASATLSYLVRSEPTRCSGLTLFISEDGEDSTHFAMDAVSWVEQTGRLGEWAAKNLGDSESDGILTLSEALELGFVVDVSEAGRVAGLPCSAFVSASLWRGDELRCSKELLKDVLRAAARFCGRDDFTVYGSRRCRIVPSVDEGCRVDFTVTLEPDEQVGLYVLITSWGGEREIKIRRVGSSESRYAM
jgi:hypothetical protein